MQRSIKIFITFLSLALALLVQFNSLDKIGLEHTEAGLNRALITYGISRGLNGVISVVQGTEIAIEPVGVGMTFTPGQILDPVNDLIERFSTVVLVSGTAFGIQRVLLEIISTPIFSAVVGALVILAVCFFWFAKPHQQKLRGPVYKIALIFLIIRLSVPLVAISGEKFYEVFLAPQFVESSQQLLATTAKLENIQAESEASVGANSDADSDKSLLESARELYRSATRTLDVDQHLEDFKKAAEDVSEHAIKLIVVFVFQTIILPLGSIWIVLKTIKWIASKRMQEYAK